ncbi:MAG TPA: DUF2339 domain-containing protein [Tepidisphaeraceae bacterium]|jgi:uncharacterized membrane protein|nr:DUF2339 domain-containing protein [Tepidisphaeraceae bacterium]
MSQQTIDERLEHIEQRLTRVERWVELPETEEPASPEAVPAIEASMPEATAAPAPVPLAVSEAAAGRRVVEVEEMDEFGHLRPPRRVVIERPIAEPMAVEPIESPMAQLIIDHDAPANLTLPDAQVAIHRPVANETAVEAMLTSRGAPQVGYAQPERPAPVRQTAFERTVGLKWAGWAGAIVMAIGAAMGLKFAYEQGMFAIVPPGARLVMLYLGGFALLGAGEVVYRRVNKLSAVGLFGAGVAMLFVVSYAGHGYFQLYEQSMALVLMALSTLIGAAIALRGGFVSIAVLSILGGHVAPIVLGSGTAAALPLFSYLVALQGVALILAALGREPKWWTLRGLSLATTALWMTPAILSGLGTPGQQLFFSILFAALFQAELIYSNWPKRLTTTDGPSGATRHRAEAASGLAFSMIVTAALAAAGLAIFADDTGTTRATWMLALAAGAMGLRLLTGRQQDAMRQLSLSYSVQAAALVAAAAPVALGGMALSLAWAVLAIAFGGIAAVTGSRVARFFSPAVWVLSIGYLAAWAMSQRDLVMQTIAGQPVPEVGLMAAGLAIVGYVVARVLMIRVSDAERADVTYAARGIAGVATLTFTAAAIASLPGLMATLALVAFAWLLTAADPLARRLHLAFNGLAVLAIATAKWAVVDMLANGVASSGAAAGYDPFFNPLMGVGVIIVASLAAVVWIRRRALLETLQQMGDVDPAGRLLEVSVMTIVGLLTLGLSVEVHRAVASQVASGVTLARPPMQLTLLGLTMLWTAAVVVCRLIITLASRAQQRSTPAVPVLVGAMAVLAMKYMLYDTLSFRFNNSNGRVAGLVNAELFTATVLVVAMLLVRWIGAAAQRSLGHMLLIIAGVVVGWAGTIQIDSYVAVHGGGAWPDWQLRQMLWTTWWTLCTIAAAVLVMRVNPAERERPVRLSGWLAVASTLLAAKFILIDVLVFYVFLRQPSVTAALNMQGVTAIAVMALLAMSTMLTQRCQPPQSRLRPAALLTLLAGVAIALLWGTIEIGRLFNGPFGAAFASPARARGVATSIFWAAFAIASVAAGFQWRTAALRYVGLGLFAVTLLKVFFVDLGEVGTGYRILSFFGLGLLLLGTSVLYGKLGPKLLEGEGDVSASLPTREGSEGE